jgi:hypothetical protein
MSSSVSWLPLAEYSIKHQVSISTLRRRIKTEDIQFRFDDGKYFIQDDQPASTQQDADEHRPSLRSDVQPRSAQYSAGSNSPGHSVSSQLNTQTLAQNATPTQQPQQSEASESVITAANRLLTDLKKAYTQVLHEKENQIQHLRQELADIKTLVKVLEFENEKLRDYNR